jgi:hypothetical protein
MILGLIDILAKGSGGSPSSDADSSIKFIFGAIVLVIWVVGGIMSQMKKKADRERWNNPQPPQQDWSHLLRDLTAGQNKPFTPGTPAPPHLQQQRPQQQVQNRQRMQQTKSFAQQSPRPFVQQYPQRQPTPQYVQRPLPPRRQAMKPVAAKPFQGPRPIQRKVKPQRRPPPIPAQTMQVRKPPEAQVGLIQKSNTVTMGQAGGATAIQTSGARSVAPRVTRGQLGKLIIWSEILAPPLALREVSPK